MPGATAEPGPLTLELHLRVCGPSQAGAEPTMTMTMTAWGGEGERMKSDPGKPPAAAPPHKLQPRPQNRWRWEKPSTLKQPGIYSS